MLFCNWAKTGLALFHLLEMTTVIDKGLDSSFLHPDRAGQGSRKLLCQLPLSPSPCSDESRRPEEGPAGFRALGMGPVL